MSFISNAGEVLAFATTELVRRKTALIQALTTNCRCPWTVRELESKSLNELKKLAEMGGITMNQRPENYDPPKILLA
jgi:hypothetical protein